MSEIKNGINIPLSIDGSNLYNDLKKIITKAQKSNAINLGIGIDEKQLNAVVNSLKKASSEDMSSLFGDDIDKVTELLKYIDDIENKMSDIKKIKLLDDSSKKAFTEDIQNFLKTIPEEFSKHLDFGNINLFDKDIIAEQFKDLQKIIQANVVNTTLKSVGDIVKYTSKGTGSGGTGTGAGTGTEEKTINNLETIEKFLNEINESIKTIITSIGILDNESPFKNVIESLGLLNDQMDDTVERLRKMYTRIGQTQMNINIQEDNSLEQFETNEQIKQVISKTLNQLETYYKNAFETVNKKGFHPETIWSALHTSSVGSAYAHPDEIKDIFSLSAINKIDDARDRIEVLIKFFNMLKIAIKENKDSMEDFWIVLQTIKIPRDGLLAFNKKIGEISGIETKNGKRKTAEEKTQSILDKIQGTNDKALEKNDKLDENKLNVIISKLESIVELLSKALIIKESIESTEPTIKSKTLDLVKKSIDLIVESFQSIDDAALKSQISIGEFSEVSQSSIDDLLISITKVKNELVNVSNLFNSLTPFDNDQISKDTLLKQKSTKFNDKNTQLINQFKDAYSKVNDVISYSPLDDNITWLKNDATFDQLDEISKLTNEILPKMKNAGIDIGEYLTEGIAQGIPSGINAIKQAEEQITEEAKEYMENINGIHSPAREWMPIGRNIAYGIAEGVKQGLYSLQDAMSYITLYAKQNAENESIIKNDDYQAFSNEGNFLKIREMYQIRQELINAGNEANDIDEALDKFYNTIISNNSIETKLKSISDYIKSIKSDVTEITENVIPSIENVNNSLDDSIKIVNNYKEIKEIISEIDDMDRGFYDHIRANGWDDNTKMLLQQLGIVDELGNRIVELNDNGEGKRGALITDNFAILLKYSSEEVDVLDQMISKIGQAKQEGVIIAQILGEFSTSKGDYQVQERLIGSSLYSQKHNGYNLLDEQNNALQVKDDHLQKLIKDYLILEKLGLEIDGGTSANFLYNHEEGFGFIDLSLKETTNDALGLFKIVRSIITIMTGGIPHRGMELFNNDYIETTISLLAKVKNAFLQVGYLSDEIDNSILTWISTERLNSNILEKVNSIIDPDKVISDEVYAKFDDLNKNISSVRTNIEKLNYELKESTLKTWDTEDSAKFDVSMKDMLIDGYFGKKDLIKTVAAYEQQFGVLPDVKSMNKDQLRTNVDQYNLEHRKYEVVNQELIAEKKKLNILKQELSVTRQLITGYNERRANSSPIINDAHFNKRRVHNIAMVRNANLNNNNIDDDEIIEVSLFDDDDDDIEEILLEEFEEEINSWKKKVFGKKLAQLNNIPILKKNNSSVINQVNSVDELYNMFKKYCEIQDKMSSLTSSLIHSDSEESKEYSKLLAERESTFNSMRGKIDVRDLVNNKRLLDNKAEFIQKYSDKFGLPNVNPIDQIDNYVQEKINSIKSEKNLLKELREINDFGDYGKENSYSTQQYNEALEIIKNTKLTYEEIYDIVKKINHILNESTELRYQTSFLSRESEEYKELNTLADQKRKEVDELTHLLLPISEIWEDSEIFNKNGNIIFGNNEDKTQELILSILEYVSTLKLELEEINDQEFANIIKNITSLKESYGQAKKSIETTEQEFAKIGSVFRGVKSQQEEFFHGFDRPEAAIWATSVKDLYNTIYTGHNMGKEYSADYYAKNPLIIDAKGQSFNDVTYLGNGFDEVSKKITELYNRMQELKYARQKLVDQGDKESKQYIEILKELGLVSKKYDEISKSKNNVYGTHWTDDFVPLAKNNGYDAIVFNNIMDDTGVIGTTYAVWNNDQIKNVKLIASGEKELLEIHEQLNQLSISDNENLLIATTSLHETEQELGSINEKVNDVNKSTQNWYRTVRDLNAIFSENGHAWFIDTEEGAKTYQNVGLNSSGNDQILKTNDIDMNNIFSFDANGQSRKEITYLGDSSDEASKNITELYNKLNQLKEKESELQAQLNSDNWTEELYQESEKLSQEISEVYYEFEKLSNNTNNMYGTHDTRWFQQTAEALGYLGIEIKNVIDLGDMANRNSDELFTSNILCLFDKSKVGEIYNITNGLNELVEVTQKIKPFKIPIMEILFGNFDSINWKEYTDEEKIFAEQYNNLLHTSWLSGDMKDEIGWNSIINDLTNRAISANEAIEKLKNGINDVGIKYGKIQPDKSTLLSGNTTPLIEEQNKLQEKVQESIKKYVELREQKILSNLASNSNSSKDRWTAYVDSKSEGKKSILQILSQIEEKQNEINTIDKEDIALYRNKQEELLSLKGTLLGIYDSFLYSLNGSDRYLGKGVLDKIKAIELEIESLSNSNINTGYTDLFNNLINITKLDPNIIATIFQTAEESAKGALYIIEELDNAIQQISTTSVFKHKTTPDVEQATTPLQETEQELGNIEEKSEKVVSSYKNQAYELSSILKMLSLIDGESEIYSANLSKIIKSQASRYKDGNNLQVALKKNGMSEDELRYIRGASQTTGMDYSDTFGLDNLTITDMKSVVDYYREILKSKLEYNNTQLNKSDIEELLKALGLLSQHYDDGSKNGRKIFSLPNIDETVDKYNNLVEIIDYLKRNSFFKSDQSKISSGTTAPLEQIPEQAKEAEESIDGLTQALLNLFKVYQESKNKTEFSFLANLDSGISSVVNGSNKAVEPEDIRKQMESLGVTPNMFGHTHPDVDIASFAADDLQAFVYWYKETKGKLNQFFVMANKEFSTFDMSKIPESAFSQIEALDNDYIHSEIKDFAESFTTIQDLKSSLEKGLTDFDKNIKLEKSNFGQLNISDEQLNEVKRIMSEVNHEIPNIVNQISSIQEFKEKVNNLLINKLNNSDILDKSQKPVVQKFFGDFVHDNILNANENYDYQIVMRQFVQNLLEKILKDTGVAVSDVYKTFSIDKLNQYIPSLIPQPNKNGVSSGTNVQTQQEEIRSEIQRTSQEIIEEQKALGELNIAFRGLSGSMNGFISTTDRGMTFFTESPYLAREYADALGGVYQANVALGKSLYINGKGRDWNNIEYLGDGADEASRKIIELRNTINSLQDQIQFNPNAINTGLDGRVEVSRGDYSEMLQCYGAMGKEYSSYIEAVEAGNLIELQEDKTIKQLMIDLYEAEKAYKLISDAKDNVYGTHTTNEFGELAKGLGYDSVMFENIKDSFDSLSRLTTVGVIFDESQVASVKIVNEELDKLINKIDHISGTGYNFPPYEPNKTNTSTGSTSATLTEESTGQLAFVEGLEKTANLIEEETGQMALFKDVEEKATDDAIEGQMTLNDYINKTNSSLEGQVNLFDYVSTQKKEKIDYESINNQLEEINTKSIELSNRIAQMFANQVMDGQSENYYTGLLNDIQEVENELDNLQTKQNNIQIPEGHETFISKSNGNNLMFNNIRALIEQQKQNVHNVYDTIDFEAQKAQQELEAKQSARQNEMMQRIVNTDNWQTVSGRSSGAMGLFTEYLSRAYKEETEIDELYSEFLTKYNGYVSELKAIDDEEDRIADRRTNIRSALTQFNLQGYSNWLTDYQKEIEDAAQSTEKLEYCIDSLMTQIALEKNLNYNTPNLDMSKTKQELQEVLDTFKKTDNQVGHLRSIYTAVNKILSDNAKQNLEWSVGGLEESQGSWWAEDVSKLNIVSYYEKLKSEGKTIKKEITDLYNQIKPEEEKLRNELQSLLDLQNEIDPYKLQKVRQIDGQPANASSAQNSETTEQEEQLTSDQKRRIAQQERYNRLKEEEKEYSKEAVEISKELIKQAGLKLNNEQLLINRLAAEYDISHNINNLLDILANRIMNSNNLNFLKDISPDLYEILETLRGIEEIKYSTSDIEAFGKAWDFILRKVGQIHFSLTQGTGFDQIVNDNLSQGLISKIFDHTLDPVSGLSEVLNNAIDNVHKSIVDELIFKGLDKIGISSQEESKIVINSFEDINSSISITKRSLSELVDILIQACNLFGQEGILEAMNAIESNKLFYYSLDLFDWETLINKANELNNQYVKNQSKATKTIVENENAQQEAYENTSEAISNNVNNTYNNNQNNNNDNSSDNNTGKPAKTDNLSEIDISNYKVLKQIGILEQGEEAIVTYQNGYGQIVTVLQTLDDCNNIVTNEVLALTTSFKDLESQVKSTFKAITDDEAQLKEQTSIFGDNYDSTAIDKRIKSNKDKLEALFAQSRIYADDDQYALQYEQFTREYANIQDSITNDQAVKDAKKNAQQYAKNLQKDINDAYAINKALNNTQNMMSDFQKNSGYNINGQNYFKDTLASQSVEIQNLNSQLKNGTISLEDYNNAVGKVKSTLELSEKSIGAFALTNNSIKDTLFNVANLFGEVDKFSTKYNETTKTLSFNLKSEDDMIRKLKISYNELTGLIQVVNDETKSTDPSSQLDKTVSESEKLVRKYEEWMKITDQIGKIDKDIALNQNTNAQVEKKNELLEKQKRIYDELLNMAEKVSQTEKASYTSKTNQYQESVNKDVNAAKAKARADENAKNSKEQKLNATSTKQLVNLLNDNSLKFNFSKQVDDATVGLQLLDQMLLQYNNDLESGKITLSDYNKFINNYNTMIGEATSKLKAYKALGSGVISEDNITSLQEALSYFEKYAKGLGTLESTIKYSEQPNQNGIYKMSVNVAQSNGEIKKLTANWSNAVQTIVVGSNIIGKKTNGLSEFFNGLKNKISTLTQYWTAMYLNPYRMISSIKTGIGYLEDYNDALTNVSYTMDITQKSLNSLGETMLNTAQKYGSSIEDAMAVAEIYANMNTTAKEIEELSAPTLILSNLTGVDASTAADEIQAVTQQFNIAAEESMHIVDVYDYISSQIAVNYATGIEGMATAVENVGQTAESAGLSFEQLSAIIAKTEETTRQSGSTIANALKTIMVRISKASKLSDEIDNSTLSKASAALKAIGIEVYESNGEYREFDTIMSELANKWDTLTDAERANLSYQIAATRQSTLFQAILQNWDDSMQLATEATEANGNALKNEAKYLNSYTGKLKTLSTEGQSAWIHFLNNEETLKFIDGLTKLVGVIDKVIKKIGSLTIISTGLLSLYMTFKKQKGVFSVVDSDLTKSGKQLAIFGNSLSSLIQKFKEFINLKKSGQGTGSFISYMFGGENPSSAINDFNKFSEAWNAAQANFGTSFNPLKFINSYKKIGVYQENFIKNTESGIVLNEEFATSFKTLSLAQQASIVAMKAAAIALNVLLSIGIMVAITAIVSVLNKLNNKLEDTIQTTKRLKKRNEEIVSSIDDINSKIDELTQKISDNENAIDEIKSKGHLTFIDEQEINKLKTTNSELKNIVNYLNEAKSYNVNKYLNNLEKQIDNEYHSNASQYEKGISGWKKFSFFNVAYSFAKSKSSKTKSDLESNNFENLSNYNASEVNRQFIYQYILDNYNNILNANPENIKNIVDELSNSTGINRIIIQSILNSFREGMDKSDLSAGIASLGYNSQISKDNVIAFLDANDWLGFSSNEVIDSSKEKLKENRDYFYEKLQEALEVDPNAENPITQSLIAKVNSLDYQIDPDAFKISAVEESVEGIWKNIDGTIENIDKEHAKRYENQATEIQKKIQIDENFNIDDILNNSDWKQYATDLAKHMFGVGSPTEAQIQQSAEYMVMYFRQQAVAAASDLSFNDIFDLGSDDSPTDLGQISKDIDNIQKAFKTLHEAVNEYDTNGVISVDTLQSVIELGEGYLEFVDAETGALKLDDEALQSLTASRLQDLRVQALNNMYDNIQKITNEDTALQYLTDTNYKYADSVIAVSEAETVAYLNRLQTEGNLTETTKNSVIDAMYEKRDKINALFDNVGIDYKSITGGSGSGSSNDTSSNEDVVDFVERRLNKLNELIDETQENIDQLEGSASKNTAIDAMFSVDENKIATLEKASDLYQQMADRYLEKIPEEYRELAKNGGLDITIFNSDDDSATTKAINNYQTWADKASDCNSELLKLKQTLKDLQVTKFNNLKDDFDNLTGVIDDNKDKINNVIELLEDQGQKVSKGLYEQLIDETNTKIGYLKDERNRLMSQMDSALANGIDMGSDEWLEMYNALQEVDSAIIESQKDIEGFQDSIDQLHWNTLDDIKDAFDSISSEIGNIIDLLDEDEVTNENGIFTNKAIAQVGLYAQQYELAKNAVDQYTNEMKYLESQYNSGKISEEEYTEKLNELREARWGEIQAAEDAKDGIIALAKARVEEQIDAINEEIDAYEELIDKKKEALDAEKKLHDYKKSIANAQKEITDLQRQINARMGSDDAATVAERLKLQEELAEKEEELAELKYDHNIESQEDALEKELKDYKEAQEERIEILNNSLKNETALLIQYTNEAKRRANEISTVLTTIENEQGIKIQNCIINPWKQGSNAISSYGSVLSSQTSVFTNNLNSIKTVLIQAQTNADNLYTSLKNAFGLSSSSTSSAVQTLYSNITTANSYAVSLYNTLSGVLNGNFGTGTLNGINNLLNSVKSLKTYLEELQEKDKQMYQVKSAAGTVVGIYDTEDQAKTMIERMKTSGLGVGSIQAVKFAKGGVISTNVKDPIAQSLGEDVSIYARNGERILTADQNKDFEKLVNYIPVVLPALDNIAPMIDNVFGNLSSIDAYKHSGNITSNTINVTNTMTVEGNVDKNFAKQFEDMQNQFTSNITNKISNSLSKIGVQKNYCRAL